MARLVLLLCVVIAACVEQPLSYDDAIAHCEQLKEQKLKSSDTGFVYVSPDCLEGANLPEFTAETLEGKSIDAEYLRGKVNVVNLWFITCPPCVAEIPGFQALTERYANAEVNFLALGRDKAQDVTEFLGEHQWAFDHVADANPLIKEVFQMRWGYPTTMVTDKDGKIIKAFSGGSTDSTAVQQIQDKLIPVIEEALTD